MYDTLVTTRELLIGAALAAAFYGVIYLLKWRGHANKGRLAIEDDLVGEISRLSIKMQDIHERLDRIEAHFEQVPENNIRAFETSETSTYVAADRLLTQGLSVGEVASRLGISCAEVDLIAALRRNALTE
jgi:hypothetical protein